jgi:type I site-specific restriction endonuclease
MVPLKEAAESMNQFAETIESQIPDYREAYSTAMDSYGKAAGLLRDFETSEVTQVEEAQNTVRGIRETLNKAADAVLKSREAIAKHPRVSTAYNHAKGRTIKALTNLETEMRIGINLALEVESTMQGITADYGKEN